MSSSVRTRGWVRLTEVDRRAGRPPCLCRPPQAGAAHWPWPTAADPAARATVRPRAKRHGGAGASPSCRH
eukprot:4560413-Prymnesium_polylepis.1